MVYYLISHIWIFLTLLIIGLFVSLEYHDKFKHILLWIKIQVNPVLHTLPYEYWSQYHNFVPLKFYSITSYEWLLVLTKSYIYGIIITSDIHRTNKPECMKQLTPQVLQKYHLRVAEHQFTWSSWTLFMREWNNSLSPFFYYLHIINSTFPWKQSRWMCYPVLTGMRYFNDHDMYLYAHFPGYQFAPLAYSSRIHLHDTS